MNTVLSKGSNTRFRTLLAFSSPRAFEKASCMRAFLMLKDLEIPLTYEVAYLNVLLNVNVCSKISKGLEPGNISKVLVLFCSFQVIE